MVPVGPFCVDRYEASRPDATATDPGQDETRAMSRLGVLPWLVHPMTEADFSRFEAACNAAGKRLCTSEEWSVACSGPDQTSYVYGTTFDSEACNCVDTYCDDFCADQAIAETSCDTGVNCGYTYYCFHEDPTGAFPGCTNGYGTFDMNGNVWEVVPSTSDARGYELRGGAFNCAWAPDRVNCSFNATWTDLYAGFRCCRDRSSDS
jgi:formylglycine-generating enzyme required for sulfatase activity